MANIEDAKVVEEFKKIMITRLRDVMMALPALVPQSEDDKALFKRSMNALLNMVYNLEHAENVREIGRYIDVQKVLRDFDAESIRTLDSKINSSARASIEKMSDMARMIRGDD